MIIAGTFNDIDSKYDEVWLIVRSLKSVPQGNNIYHVPQLSPSTDLFHKYLQWREAGEWNEETFKNKYVPQFLHEMKSPEACNALNALWAKSRDKHILLVCYCQEESMCHRSIVIGLLQGCGSAVTVLEPDYSHYWTQYKQIQSYYLLVAGSRGFSDYDRLKSVLDNDVASHVQNGESVVIISGGANGADKLAERYADERGFIKHIMPANWNKYGKSAGYRRNTEMHDFIANPSDRQRKCICFWDGKSPGTKHNFGLARSHATPIEVYEYNSEIFLTPEEVEACS